MLNTLKFFIHSGCVNGVFKFFVCFPGGLVWGFVGEWGWRVPSFVMCPFMIVCTNCYWTLQRNVLQVFFLPLWLHFTVVSLGSLGPVFWWGRLGPLLKYLGFGVGCCALILCPYFVSMKRNTWVSREMINHSPVFKCVHDDVHPIKHGHSHTSKVSIFKIPP